MDIRNNNAFIREIILNVSRSVEVFLFLAACFIDTLTPKRKGKKKRIVICRNPVFFLQLSCLMANI